MNGVAVKRVHVRALRHSCRIGFPPNSQSDSQFRCFFATDYLS